MEKITRFFITAMVLSVMMLVTSCIDCIEGDGNMISKTLDVPAFSKIKLNGDANITLTSDSTALFLIKGEKNILDEYRVEVVNKTLVIKSEHCLRSHEQVTLQIPYTELESVVINGSGSVYANETVRSESLDLKINGSGDFELPVEVQDLTGSISGSGDLLLKGSAKNLEYTINGSGNIETPDLTSEQCSVTVNGSGDCSVWATGNLKVKVHGSGDVYYKGNPAIQTDIKGSGSVTKKE
ncbi:MAG TPA: head GIN domain-containing protein [Bacteroidales bacterium]|nr:head GIN domain-containing protein [Bacteroidales bacterium]HPT01119.1 head GIN domain-containing protein [Bacteroidales bacterium]